MSIRIDQGDTGTPGASRNLAAGNFTAEETGTYTTYAWSMAVSEGCTAALSNETSKTCDVTGITARDTVTLFIEGDGSPVGHTEDTVAGQTVKVSSQGGAAVLDADGERNRALGETLQFGGWNAALESDIAQAKADAAAAQGDATTNAGAITTLQGTTPTANQKTSLAQLDGAAHGSVFYAASSTRVARLTPGTAGEALLSQGAAANPAWGAVAPPASAVALARIPGSTYSTAQHLQDIFHSAGWTSGGLISDAGGATVDVTAGTGLIRATASSLAEILYCDWGASLGIAIPADTVRYVGVEYNAGAPQVVLRTSYDWDFHTDFPLGTVVNEAGVLHFQGAAHAVGDHASQMIQRLYETLPFVRDARNGGLIVSGTGTRNVAVTAGALWERLERFAIGAFDTSVADTFPLYYRDGIGGWTLVATQTQWPNTQYDDGSGTLVTMTNNRWANIWFYVELDGDIVAVYGQAEYVLQGSATEDGPPPALPDRIPAHGRLLGRVTFQKSAATGTFQTAFDESLNPTLVSDHGNLAGLADDDHAQYALADGSRAFTGGVSGAVQVLTPGATVTPDCSLGTGFTLAIGNPTTTVNAPTNAPGSYTVVVIEITQDATPRTLAFGAGIVEMNNGTPITLPAGSGDLAVLTLVTFNGGTTWRAMLASEAVPA